MTDYGCLITVWYNGAFWEVFVENAEYNRVKNYRCTLRALWKSHSAAVREKKPETWKFNNTLFLKHLYKEQVFYCSASSIHVQAATAVNSSLLIYWPFSTDDFSAQLHIVYLCVVRPAASAGKWSNSPEFSPHAASKKQFTIGKMLSLSLTAGL